MTLLSSNLTVLAYVPSELGGFFLFIGARTYDSAILSMVHFLGVATSLYIPCVPSEFRLFAFYQLTVVRSYSGLTWPWHVYVV